MRADQTTPSVSFNPQVVLRARRVDGVFDLSFAYCRQFKADLLRLTASLVLPAMAIIWALQSFFNLDWFLSLGLALLAAPFIESVCTVYIGRHLFSNATSVFDGLRTVAKNTGFTLTAMVLTSAPVVFTLYDIESVGTQILGGLGCLIWPFLLASVLYLLPVHFLEKGSFKNSRRRAFMLIRRRFGRGLCFVLLAICLRIVVAYNVELVARFVTGTMLRVPELFSVASSQTPISWAVILGVLLSSPLIAVARVFEYVDVRTTREGWDIQTRFQAIATEAEARRKKRYAP